MLERNENIMKIFKRMNFKPTYTNNNNYQAKELDRDSSEYIYVKKLDGKVILEPKQSSLDYYQVKCNEDTKKYVQTLTNKMLSQKRFVYSCYFVSFITQNIIFNVINLEYFIRPFKAQRCICPFSFETLFTLSFSSILGYFFVLFSLFQIDLYMCFVVVLVCFGGCHLCWMSVMCCYTVSVLVLGHRSISCC